MIAVMVVNSSVVQSDEELGRSLHNMMKLTGANCVAVHVLDFTSEYRQALALLFGEEVVEMLERQEE